MKKKIIVLALIVTLLCSGCGSKIPTLSNGDEAVVTLKDGSMISVNDLYTNLKDDYALQTMVTLVDKKILEEKYSDQVEAGHEYADTNMQQLEQYYGDGLLSAIQQNTSFQTLEGYKDSIYVGYLQNLAIDDYAKKQITEKEIKNYYKNDVVGDIKVSHILISANVTDDMTDEDKKKAEEEAKEKAEALITELKKASKEEIANKFAELAKEQSEDESTKENGGSLGFINKDTLSESYDELVDAAYKLKDGEFSTKVVTTEIGYHVILRSESKEKAELDDDLKESITEKLASTYLTENQIATVKALQELRKDYEMEIIDSDLKTQYAEYIQKALSYYQQQADQKNNQSTNDNQNTSESK